MEYQLACNCGYAYFILLSAYCIMCTICMLHTVHAVYCCCPACHYMHAAFNPWHSFLTRLAAYLATYMHTAYYYLHATIYSTTVCYTKSPFYISLSSCCILGNICILNAVMVINSLSACCIVWNICMLNVLTVLYITFCMLHKHCICFSQNSLSDKNPNITHI